MKLLTQAILKSLPALYETEGIDIDNKKIITKFFCPWNHWTWYAVEYDPKTETFFGFVQGNYDEWGYFSLAEMRKIRGSFGLKIERDLYFKPCKFKNLKKMYKEVPV